MPLFLFALALMVVSAGLQMLLTPKATKPKPAALEEFDFPQTEEGTPQPIIFGDVWTSDWIVLWFGNYRTSRIKSSSAKK